MIKITFLNSFLCEKIDSFQKFLKHALCHKSDFNFSYNLRNHFLKSKNPISGHN